MYASHVGRHSSAGGSAVTDAEQALALQSTGPLSRLAGMRSRVAGLLLAGLLLFIGTGCDLGLPQIGAECAGRADAPLCQAALDAAMPQLAPYMGERHTLRVGPVGSVRRMGPR